MQRELSVSTLTEFQTANNQLIVVDLVDVETGENEAVVAVELKRDCMEVRVSGFLVATFPMGHTEVQ